jgi:phosphohistidine phosphatase
MKTLYLLRHAKSSWGNASLRDFDRPLNDRGREAAERIGKRLASENLSTPLIVCSPALRTRETAEIVLRSSNLRAEQRFDERIYEASLQDLTQVISDLPDDEEVAILIGHNPGLEELLAFLTGEARRMPTCALAKIKLELVSWQDIKRGSGSLEWFTTVEDLSR